MNSIEPGCKARIVNRDPATNGTIVTVVNPCTIDQVKAAFPDKNDYDHNRRLTRWNIDKAVPVIQVHTDSIDVIPERYVDHVPDGNLERIDYDGDQASSWDAMVDDNGNQIFKPAEVVA